MMDREERRVRNELRSDVELVAKNVNEGLLKNALLDPVVMTKAREAITKCVEYAANQAVQGKRPGNSLNLLLRMMAHQADIWKHLTPKVIDIQMRGPAIEALNEIIGILMPFVPDGKKTEVSDQIKEIAERVRHIGEAGIAGSFTGD